MPFRGNRKAPGKISSRPPRKVLLDTSTEVRVRAYRVYRYSYERALEEEMRALWGLHLKQDLADGLTKSDLQAIAARNLAKYSFTK